ncbi:unnamed protein product [Choristocarpus tenellus]
MDVVTEEVKKGDGGPIGMLTGVTEMAITGLHDFLAGIGIPSPYGLSIIMFTLFVKGITFPLTYKQLSSTSKMQALAPKVKELQARYANNPEAANGAIQQLYQREDVNPLAGCLPAIAQIPIFISLYRSLLNLAKEDKLGEPFLWIPSLEGPVFDAPPTETLNWLKDWHADFAPKLGWHDTLCYLTIPLILVITQSLSMQLMQPAKDPNAPVDEAQAASQNVLKFLPLLIGWFSLNVPAGLGVYWIVNNFVSTASSVYIKNQVSGEKGLPKVSLPFQSEPEQPVAVTTPVPRPTQSTSAASEAPQGFGNMVKDNEVEGQIIMGDGTEVPVSDVTAPTPPPTPKQPKSSKKSWKKKKKGRKS